MDSNCRQQVKEAAGFENLNADDWATEGEEGCNLQELVAMSVSAVGQQSGAARLWEAQGWQD